MVDKKRTGRNLINRPVVDVPWRIKKTPSALGKLPVLDPVSQILPEGMGGAISKDVLEDIERSQAAKEAAQFADPGPVINRPEVDVPYPSREDVLQVGDVPQVEEDPQMVEEVGSFFGEERIAITRDAEPEFETTGEVEVIEGGTVTPQFPDGSSSVKRADDFKKSGEYIVTLPDGSTRRIFRDTEQFSSPTWHIVGDQENPAGIGSTKAEAVEYLERQVAGELETFETTVEPSPTDVANTAPNKLVEFFREVISDDQDFREGRMKDPDYRKRDLRYGINWDVPTSTTEGIHFKLKDGTNLSVVPTENENEALIKDLYQTHQTRETEWGTLEGVDRDTSTADRISHLQQIARMADKTGTTLVAEIDPDLIFFRSQGHKYFAPIPQAEYIRDAYPGLDDPTIDGWEFVDNWPADKTVIIRFPQPFDAEWDMPVTKKDELIQRQKDWKESGEQESQEREQRIAEEKRAAAAEKAATLADPGPPTYESRVQQRSDSDIENIRGHALANFKVTGGSPDREVNQMISLMPRRSHYFKTIPFSGVDPETGWGTKRDQNSFWYRGFPVHRRTTGSAGMDKYYLIYAPDNKTLIFQGYTTEYTKPGTKYVPNHALLYGRAEADLVKSRKVIKRIIDEYWTNYDKNTPDGALLTDPEKSVGKDYTKGQFKADMEALRLDEFLEAPHIGSVQQFHAGGFVEASTLSTASPFIV